jgi:K+-sensing histidine kinase KdpD
MAIVHRIISAHGGSISAGTSSLGGAEICLTLPTRAAHKRNA